MEGTEITANARRVLEEVFPANDKESLRELISDRFVNHEAPPGTPPGRGSVEMFMDLLAAAFTDQRWEIHQTVTQGDTVVLQCTHSGVHTGDWFGIPASGKRFAYKQVHIVRFEDGMGVEHWAVRDDAALMRQLSGSDRPLDAAVGAES